MATTQSGTTLPKIATVTAIIAADSMDRAAAALRCMASAFREPSPRGIKGADLAPLLGFIAQDLETSKSRMLEELRKA